MQGFLKILGALALAVVLNMWKGFVITLLWAWFIVTTFHLPALGLAAAIGLSCVSAILTWQYGPKDIKDIEENNHQAIILSFFYPALTLLIGWIAHMFM